MSKIYTIKAEQWIKIVQLKHVTKEDVKKAQAKLLFFGLETPSEKADLPIDWSKYTPITLSARQIKAISVNPYLLRRRTGVPVLVNHIQGRYLGIGVIVDFAEAVIITSAADVVVAQVIIEINS